LKKRTKKLLSLKKGSGLVHGAALACLLGGCASDGAAHSAGGLMIPEQDFHIAEVRLSPKPLPGALNLPPGPGPFPVVILLHGCSGLGRGLAIWAARLADWGYASLILDSFSSRNVYTVCEPSAQKLVTRRDRAGDALSAAMYLQHVPGIDPDRIAVMGFSHGGATAFTLTQQDFQAAAPGLIKASVDYYGACRDPSEHGTVPLLALAGEADTWGDPARRCTEFAGQLRPDQPFEVKTYPGVVHAFDNPLQKKRFEVGHELEYDAPAAADSFVRVRAFLDRYLHPRT